MSTEKETMTPFVKCQYCGIDNAFHWEDQTCLSDMECPGEGWEHTQVQLIAGLETNTWHHQDRNITIELKEEIQWWKLIIHLEQADILIDRYNEREKGYTTALRLALAFSLSRFEKRKEQELEVKVLSYEELSNSNKSCRLKLVVTDETLTPHIRGYTVATYIVGGDDCWMQHSAPWLAVAESYEGAEQKARRIKAFLNGLGNDKVLLD